MKIEISQDEIKSAVICYLEKQGINVEEFNVELKMTAGRKGDYRIDIDLQPSITAEAFSEHPGQQTLSFGTEPATTEE